MFKWNTDKISSDLLDIPNVEAVIEHDPGGDVDTSNLLAKVTGADEYIYVCGFSVDNVITDPRDTDIEMVEITDQSGDGLQSIDFEVARAYIAVRQYFVGQNVEVVNRLKDYF